MNIAHYIHKPADIFRYHSLPVRNMYHRLSRLLKFRDYRCRSLEVERNQSPQDKISDKKGYCFTSALSKKRVLINAIDYGKERIEKYNSDKPELLIIKAIIAANNNTNPLAASSLKNHLKGLDK